MHHISCSMATQFLFFSPNHHHGHPPFLSSTPPSSPHRLRLRSRSFPPSPSPPAAAIAMATQEPHSLLRSRPPLPVTDDLHSKPLSSRSRNELNLAARLCDLLESAIDKEEDRRSSAVAEQGGRNNIDPLGAGNFFPVFDECEPVECEVEGGARLPGYLNGVYLRNGPNQRFRSTASSSCHLFDGDGMVHAITISGAGTPQQRVTYARRYVRTSRWRQEDAAGRQLFPRVFTSARSDKGGGGIPFFALAIFRHLLGVIDLSEGMGLANSGLVYHRGKLLALSEDDLPHAMELLPNGDLRTVGRYAFQSESQLQGHWRQGMPIWAMTSHPKIDPVTGEMFGFGYNPLFRPHLTLFRVGDGTSSDEEADIATCVPVGCLREASMMHDFGLTPRYAIFPDVQLVFRPLELLYGRSPLVVDRNKVARFGVLRRDAEDDSGMRWLEAPGCNCFHVLNCWEEGEVVVMVVPVVESVEHAVAGDLHNFKVSLREVRLDMESGTTEQKTIVESEELNLEMGSMNRGMVGQRNRYLYMGIAGQFPNLSGVAKVDLEQGGVAVSRGFGERCFGSEPFFVPARERGEEEDEGCVLSFVHDEDEGVSRLVVWEASDLRHVASIRIPRRVPYGFHGLFVPA